jgi:hypothetical protein
MTPTAPALARRIADAFEAEGIPHAIGGALALAAWGFPRATNDVDIDVFVEVELLDRVLSTLERAGCVVDRNACLASARDRGDFSVRYQGMRMDFFVPSIPFYRSVEARVRPAPLQGRPASYLSPEDLAVFKMLFFRTKDILDVERLVAFIGPDFDAAYVRRSLVEILGSEDQRLQRWDRLVADVRRPSRC